jgi:hypothetical protein
MAPARVWDQVWEPWRIRSEVRGVKRSDGPGLDTRPGRWWHLRWVAYAGLGSAAFWVSLADEWLVDFTPGWFALPLAFPLIVSGVDFWMVYADLVEPTYWLTIGVLNVAIFVGPLEVLMLIERLRERSAGPVAVKPASDGDGLGIFGSIDAPR